MMEDSDQELRMAQVGGPVLGEQARGMSTVEDSAQEGAEQLGKGLNPSGGSAIPGEQEEPRTMPTPQGGNMVLGGQEELRNNLNSLGDSLILGEQNNGCTMEDHTLVEQEEDPRINSLEEDMVLGGQQNGCSTMDASSYRPQSRLDLRHSLDPPGWRQAGSRAPSGHLSRDSGRSGQVQLKDKKIMDIETNGDRCLQVSTEG